MKTMLSELVKEKQNQFDNKIILAKVDGKLCEISDKEVEVMNVNSLQLTLQLAMKCIREACFLWHSKQLMM